MQFNNLHKIDLSHTRVLLCVNFYGFVMYLYRKIETENFLSQSEPRVFKHVATLEVRLGKELSVKER